MEFILKKNFYSQTVVFTVDVIYTGCFGDLRFSIWWVFIVLIPLVLIKFKDMNCDHTKIL